MTVWMQIYVAWIEVQELEIVSSPRLWHRLELMMSDDRKKENDRTYADIF